MVTRRMSRLALMATWLVALCGCQQAVVFQFYNDTRDELFLSGEKVSGTIKAKTLSDLYGCRDVGVKIAIRDRDVTRDYVLPADPKASRPFLTDKLPEMQGTKCLYALFIIDADGKLWLGDAKENGFVEKNRLQGASFPIAGAPR
jgi:hypothetical protein